MTVSPAVPASVSSRPAPSRALVLALTLAIVVLFGVLASAAQAAPFTTIQEKVGSPVTGTNPFDADDLAGNDSGPGNAIVRSYDSVSFNYTVSVNTLSPSTEAYDTVTVTQTLPTGLTWSPALPAICNDPMSSVTSTTLTCIYRPTGGGETGTTLDFSFTALADGLANGTVVPGTDPTASVTASGITSADATTHTAPLTISSAPELDLFKQSPQGSVTGGGYDITYTVGIKVPASPKGRRGFIMPTTPVTFVEDFASVSPNATFVSCGSPSSGATVDCTGATVGKTKPIRFTALPADPAADGSVATVPITVHVPSSDITDPSGQLNTVNHVTTLRANGAVIPGDADADANNTVTYNLITQSGGGGGQNAGRFSKALLAGNGTVAGGGAAYGGLLPSQYTQNDGNGQVQDGQVILSQVTIANDSGTAPVTTPGACDVWDNTRVHLSADGPGPAAHAGSPVWKQSGSVAGAVIQYSTDPTSVDPADAVRWPLQAAATDCSSGTWSSSPPADLSTVTKVRILLPTLLAGTGANTFRINLKIADSTKGDIVANFLGRRLDTTWTASNYTPADNNNVGNGQRVTTNGVTVRVQKRASSPSTSYGTPASSLAGGSVQFELKPTVTALDLGVGTPTAHNVVIRDRLPAGLIYDDGPGHAPGGGVTPVVTTDADGIQTLTWTIPTLALSASPPLLTFWVTVPVTSSGNLVNESIIASSEDLGGRTTFPSTPPASPESHYSTQTVSVASAGGVKISKQTLQNVVEPLDPLAFRITYANLTGATQSLVDIVDPLPYNGDGRTTALHGPNTLTSVDAPTSGGATVAVRYTAAPSASVLALTDPSGPRNTDDTFFDTLTWCTAAQVTAHAAGCPASIGVATGVRISRSTLSGAAGANTGTFTLHFSPTGNRSGDVYANNSAIRYGSSGNLTARSNTVTSRVVASRIGDYFWYDQNRNGIQDAGEPPVQNATVTLTGTDKDNRAISVTTTTDATGHYLFTSSSQLGQNAGVLDLVSGDYTVTFTAPGGYVFTTRNAVGSTTANDSNVDGAGRATVTMPDPSSTGTDGQNLTLDAGLVLAPPASGGGTTTTSTTTTPTPTTTTPAPPASTTPTPTTPKPKPPKGATSPSLGGGTVRHKPQMTIFKSASTKSATAGSAVVYTIKIHNIGKVDAKNVRVCDDPGKGLVLDSTPKDATFADGRLCWKLGTMAIGERRTLHVTMSILRTVTVGTVVNRVKMTATGATSKGDDASVAVTGGGVSPATAGGGVTGR